MGVRLRVLEVVEVSGMMGWGRIGVSFCGGLKEEARRMVEIFEGAGLEVYSVRCKCGGVDKAEFGIPKEHKIVSLVGGAGQVRGGVQPCGACRGAELGGSGSPYHRRSLHRPRYSVQHAFQGVHDDPHREGQGDGAQPGDIAVQRVSSPQILG